MPIRRGTWLLEYTGPLLTNAEAQEKEDRGARYLFEINNRWTIDGSGRRNLARYINHSCRPNAEVYFVRHVIKIRAIRNIKAEEEITYNYGRGYFDCFIKAVGCKCIACLRKKAKERAAARAARAARRRRQARRSSPRIGREDGRKHPLERGPRA